LLLLSGIKQEIKRIPAHWNSHLVSLCSGWFLSGHLILNIFFRNSWFFYNLFKAKTHSSNKKKKHTPKTDIILIWKLICMILDFHSSVAEDSSLLGCDITLLDEKLPVFWDQSAFMASVKQSKKNSLPVFYY
jgi:hypothetical protein